MIYDNDGPNYAASCQVAIEGNEGRMFTINGHSFYDCLSAGGLACMMQMLGVTVLTGQCVPSHLALMRRALRHVATVEQRGSVRHAGFDMVDVAVRLK